MKKQVYFSIFMLMGFFFSCEPKKALLNPDNGGGLPAQDLVQNSATASNPSGILSNVDLPRFQYADTIKNFGSIMEGEIATHIFKFRNIGKGPLIISNASASCGCTVPRWPKDPVAPGDTGSISVSFNSQGKVGSQSKIVTVTSNAEPSISKLVILAEVQKKPEDPSAKPAEPTQHLH